MECLKLQGKNINIKGIKISILSLERSYNYGKKITYSYRVKRAIAIKTLLKNSLKNENLIYKRLIYAVDMHRKAMKLVYSNNYTIFVIINNVYRI